MQPSDDLVLALARAAPDALVAVKIDGGIAFVNDQAEQLFGWERQDLTGKPAARLFPEWDGPRRQAGGGGAMRARRRDGTEFAADISVKEFQASDGAFVAVAVRDVTDRLDGQAEGGSPATETQLERSHRLESLGALAGGVAHDFNNLLGVILNFGTLITRRVTDARVLADLDEIRSAAERGATLTRQLLTFARRDVANPKPIEVNAAVREAAAMLQRTLGEQVELRLDLAPGPVVALADPNQLEQIVLNLAINARDAMPGGGRLTIGTGRRRVDRAVGGRQADAVVLWVTDTGHGMAPELVARAFEPFFTTKERGQGTGLGLATVYGIVSQNGGDVTIASTVGEGTTVTVVLPGAEEAFGDTGDSAGSSMGGHERILLVEDEPTLRSGTARLLADQGYEVLTASDGLEALEAFDREPGAIDLVLTDVAMPRMRGDELARQLAERAAPVDVILMTGYDSGKAPLPARVLAKPVAEDDLLRVIREVLDD